LIAVSWDWLAAPAFEFFYAELPEFIAEVRMFFEEACVESG